MIQVIGRTARIVTMLAADDDLSLEKLAETNALNHTTVCNILRSLMEVGWVERSGHGTYRITEYFRGLGAAPEWSPRLIAYLEHKLQTLAEDLTESVVCCTLRYNKVEVMAQGKFQHTLMINDKWLYAKLSLYTSVSGEVLCAGLPAEARRELYRLNPPTAHDLAADGDLAGYEKKLKRISDDGYNVSSNEKLGIKSWALPIYDDDHAVCACLGLSVPLIRLPQDGGMRFQKQMRKTAAEISRWLLKEKLSARHLMYLPFVY